MKDIEMLKENRSPPHIHDCIGVGFGPSNIALAIALEEKGIAEKTLFLEKAPAPDWQGEFAILGSDIQHNPLRDFVTPRNPASPYGFLGYLKAKGRLFDYLNLDAPFPPRSEYARYVVWVARQFDRLVRYSCPVENLFYDNISGTAVLRVETADGESLYARSVSFAPGRSPNIPSIYQPHLGERVIHVRDYKTAISRWHHQGDVHRIAIIGASQSAVEILLDLPSYLPDTHMTLVTRSFGIKQKDLSPFTERVYEPEFVETFYSAQEDVQAQLKEELWRSNYGAADHDVIRALHFNMYEQKVRGCERITLLENRVATQLLSDEKTSTHTLTLTNRLSNMKEDHQFDAIILATGFLNHGACPASEPHHPLLAELAKHAEFREDGAIAAQRDYRISVKGVDETPPVFLNGVSETTHGFGDAGSFSLLSVRSDEIARSIQETLQSNAHRSLAAHEKLVAAAKF